MNISKGRSEGGHYEAGNSFWNTEFVVITKEHAETLIHGCVPMTLFPCLCGSVSFKAISLDFLLLIFPSCEKLTQAAHPSTSIL